MHDGDFGRRMPVADGSESDSTLNEELEAQSSNIYRRQENVDRQFGYGQESDDQSSGEYGDSREHSQGNQDHGGHFGEQQSRDYNNENTQERKSGGYAQGERDQKTDDHDNRRNGYGGENDGRRTLGNRRQYAVGGDGAIQLRGYGKSDSQEEGGSGNQEQPDHGSNEYRNHGQEEGRQGGGRRAFARLRNGHHNQRNQRAGRRNNGQTHARQDGYDNLEQKGMHGNGRPQNYGKGREHKPDSRREENQGFGNTQVQQRRNGHVNQRGGREKPQGFGGSKGQERNGYGNQKRSQQDSEEYGSGGQDKRNSYEYQTEQQESQSHGSKGQERNGYKDRTEQETGEYGGTNGQEQRAGHGKQRQQQQKPEGHDNQRYEGRVEYEDLRGHQESERYGSQEEQTEDEYKNRRPHLGTGFNNREVIPSKSSHGNLKEQRKNGHGNRPNRQHANGYKGEPNNLRNNGNYEKPQDSDNYGDQEQSTFRGNNKRTEVNGYNKAKRFREIIFSKIHKQQSKDKSNKKQQSNVYTGEASYEGGENGNKGTNEEYNYRNEEHVSKFGFPEEDFNVEDQQFSDGYNTGDFLPDEKFNGDYHVTYDIRLKDGAHGNAEWEVEFDPVSTRYEIQLIHPYGARSSIYFHQENIH